MSPANIESHLKTASPLIGQAAAIGDRRPFNTALIVLDPDFAPVWASQNGLDGKSLQELAAEEKIRDAVQAAVDEANEKMARVEQIKKFTILPEQWEPGGDELTPTMKLKRKPIDEKYAEEIEALYSQVSFADRRREAARRRSDTAAPGGARSGRGPRARCGCGRRRRP